MAPTRRKVVAWLGTVAAILAGCVDGGTGPSEADTPVDGNGGNEGGNGNGDGDTSNPEDDTPAPPGESSYRLVVERVDEDTVHDRLDVAQLDDRPEAVRDAVRSATNERYEMDEVPDALRRFVAVEDVVHVDGTFYALEANFPEEVLRLTEVESSDVDESDVVGGDRFRRDADAADAISTAISEGEARRAGFSEFLHDLVDEYDYVTPTDPSEEVEGGDGGIYEWTIEEDDGEPPYWLDAEERDRETVYGDDVVAFESLSADAQAEIEQALDEGESGEGAVSYDDQPSVLNDDRTFQFVVIDGEYHAVRISVSN